MKAFVPREVTDRETRVAATPETVKKMRKAGLEVVVEAGAGAGSGLPDDLYTAAGATLATDVRQAYADADLVLKVNPPEERADLGGNEATLMKEGAVLVSFLYPLLNEPAVRTLLERGVSSFAMDLVPRITRAQKMDALSSQSNIAGYKAVIMAAERLGKIFPMMMTAAGTIKPAHVVILGAGVAGLQAIATAKRLGAVVEVNDIRPAVKEQVESLGGKFIDMPTPEEAEDKGGYAKDLGEEFLAKQRQILTDHIAKADVVITTALIPGRPAPRLVTEDMVKAMRPLTVIVDLAAVMGGNCELTEPGRDVVKHGVTIVGVENVPALVPLHCSEMYAQNVFAVVKHLVAADKLVIDFDDEITAGSFVTHLGGVRHAPTAAMLGVDVVTPSPAEAPAAPEAEPTPGKEPAGEPTAADDGQSRTLPEGGE